MKRNLTLPAVMALVAVMLSVSAQENPEVAPRAIPANTGPNDVARFLAGMPVSEKPPLAPPTRDPAWQSHPAFVDDQVSKLHLRHLQNLHGGQQTYPSDSLQPIR